jgi:DNA polymerase III epsilon subunit-like protein
MREIVIDIETTGLEPLDGHRVFEIGGELVNRSVNGQTFHWSALPQPTFSRCMACRLSFWPTSRCLVGSSTSS